MLTPLWHLILLLVYPCLPYSQFCVRYRIYETDHYSLYSHFHPCSGFPIFSVELLLFGIQATVCTGNIIRQFGYMHFNTTKQKLLKFPMQTLLWLKEPICIFRSYINNKVNKPHYQTIIIKLALAAKVSCFQND